MVVTPVGNLVNRRLCVRVRAAVREALAIMADKDVFDAYEQEAHIVNLREEALKFIAETPKLSAEADKLNRERLLMPWTLLVVAAQFVDTLRPTDRRQLGLRRASADERRVRSAEKLTAVRHIYLPHGSTLVIFQSRRLVVFRADADGARGRKSARRNVLASRRPWPSSSMVARCSISS
jgi:hypothetical protein